jgi:hypothetical protein
VFSKRVAIAALLIAMISLNGCTRGASFGLSRTGGALVLVKRDCDRQPMKQIEILANGENVDDDADDEQIWQATSDEAATLPSRVSLNKLPGNWKVTGRLPSFDDERSLTLWITWDNDMRTYLSVALSQLEEGFVSTWRYREQVPIRKYVAASCRRT